MKLFKPEIFQGNFKKERYWPSFRYR